MSCFKIAKQFVEDKFPESTFVLVAGSVVTGNITKTSDIDIVIIIPDLEKTFRESYFEYGWPIEIFVYNEHSYLDFFENDVNSRQSPLLEMCSKGIVIKDVNNMEKIIKDKANELLTSGPKPYSLEEWKKERYDITSLIDDLVGERDYYEQLFIVNQLTVKLCNFILVSRKQWQGNGKWIPRLLKKVDEELYSDFMNSLEEFYKYNNNKLLIDLAKRELDNYGGRLFEGYAVGKG